MTGEAPNKHCIILLKYHREVHNMFRDIHEAVCSCLKLYLEEH
jgi:hypothetical protein